MVSVTEGKLEQLHSREALTIADIQVICEHCNTQYDILDLLEHGGCECSE